MCGENRDASQVGRLTGGSSPRVRGKRLTLYFPKSFTGLIPACAGKTVLGPCCPTYMGAHPRVCGENIVVLGKLPIQMGSSPRVRGKRP